MNRTSIYFEAESPDFSGGMLDKSWIKNMRQKWGCQSCRTIHLGSEPWPLDVDIAEPFGSKTDLGPTGKGGLSLVSSRLRETMILFFPKKCWGNCWLVSTKGKFSDPDTFALNPGERAFIELWSGIGSRYKRCKECGAKSMTECVQGWRVAIEDIQENRPIYITSAGTFVIREDIWDMHFKRFQLRRRKLTPFSKVDDPPIIL